MVSRARARGIILRYVISYSAEKSGSRPATMDWEADALVNDCLIEWLQGKHTFWFGDRELGTLTLVFATYTPPGSYWLDLEGAFLNDWVQGLHNADNSKYDYLGCMLAMQGAVIRSGYTNVGPVRAYSTLPKRPEQTGAPDAAPWVGKKARYSALVYSKHESRAILFSGTLEKVIRFHEKKGFMLSRFKCTGKFSTKDPALALDGGSSDGDLDSYICCFQPTEWAGDLLAYTKASFGLPEHKVILKHRLEEGIFEKVQRDCPWAKEQLLKVEVRVHGMSGQWDKGWILFFWKQLKYCRAFYMVSTTTSVQPSPNGDPWFITALPDGSIQVHTRYDFYLHSNDKETASTFLWGALGDPREKGFELPPRPIKSNFKIALTAPPPPSRTLLNQVTWVEGALPAGFETNKPDPLPRLPGTIVTRMAYEDIIDMGKLLQSLLPKAKDALWIPAYQYGKILGGARWKELQPSHHRDMRSMAWMNQGVIPWFDKPDVMYEAIVHLAAQKLISVQNKDFGLVITREVESPMVELDTASEPTLSRRGSVSSSSSGSSKGSAASAASSTRGKDRYAQGPGQGERGFRPR
eukprot:1914811-Rhodomonas_salina.1